MGSVGEVAPALAVSPPLFDCLIIGGGLAGLSAATSLVRTLHTAIVFDAGSHRNDAAPHLATIPTWDSKDPARFREETIRNLQNKYSTVQFADVGLEKIEKVTSNEHPLLFRATDGKQREWLGKSVILAMGVSDVLPDIPGYEDCWVKGM
jgi:thioredoxin reductase